MLKKVIFISLVTVGALNANSSYESDMGGCPAGGVYHADYLGFYKCECTSYVAWKVSEEGTKLRNSGMEVNGVWKNIKSYRSDDGGYKSRFSNAHNWENAVATIGVPYDNIPHVGDIAVWEAGRSSVGHVAYVESVNSNVVTVSEYNYNNRHKANRRSFSFNKAYNRYSNDKANHYIHVKSSDTIAKGMSRAKALKFILDKFEISTKNAGFNKSRFGETISLPKDVTSSTDSYDAIVVGYNRGIVSGNNGKFYPNRDITLQEFITMIVRTIPIPLNNPKYKDYDYADSNNPFYKYLKPAYNAKILKDKSYDFDKSIDEVVVNTLLDRAFNYFRGKESGISVYMKWKQKYVDLDLYAFSSYDADGVTMETDENGKVLNMSELRNSNGVVYWNKHVSSWGTNLDYDSWGGNGKQPWVGFGEERSTVDSLMIRRPGKYSFIVCNYDWQNQTSPKSASYEMIGYQGIKNITRGGVIKGKINLGECKLGGTLTTK